MATSRNFRRRDVLASLATASALPWIGSAQAQPQNWPQRPVRLLVPFAAGGNIDIMGRLMAARLSEAVGEQFVVENRVGGSGIVATEAVARSTDGHTLLWGSTNVICIVPNITKTSYEPLRDFAPVSLLGVSPQVLVINAKIPANTVAEFVAWVKAQPQKLAYGGGGGTGSASNLMMALLLKRAALDMTSVSYRGTAPALTDVIAGHIPTTFVPMSEAYAQAKNPNLRLLAVTSRNRSKRIPDVPSIGETYPGYHAVSWTGMLAPAATPKPIVERLANEMVKATHDPKFVEQLTLNGVEPQAEGSAKFAEMIAAELPVWAEAVDIAGVRLR